MNYLAHIYLARHSEDAMVGALLGDFVGVNAAGTYNPVIEREIHIHRRIDSFTDSHPLVSRAKQLFPEGRRRFAGIALDVFFDHVLARNWDSYCAMPLDIFAQDFYRALLARRTMLPGRLDLAAGRMAEQDWLGSYRDFGAVRIAVNRISQRLSRNGELLCASVDDLEEHYEKLAMDFHAFFPALTEFAAKERAKFPELSSVAM